MTTEFMDGCQEDILSSNLLTSGKQFLVFLQEDIRVYFKNLQDDPKSLVAFFLDPQIDAFAQLWMNDPPVYRSAREILEDELVTCLYKTSPVLDGEVSTNH